MSCCNNLIISDFLFTTIFCATTNNSAATFEVRNYCLYTVWAAAMPVGGGRRLENGEAWIFSVPAGTKQGRIWGRTNCSFDASGRGKCLTGDCGGLLECQSYGSPPVTSAEYSLNQYNLDFFDISLVDGFNVPMDFNPTSNGCIRGISCPGDITGACPSELKAPGGCNNPCTVFKTDQYCCTTGNCAATNYSNFFKQMCPGPYSYPLDDPRSTFTCPGGTNYRVAFCP